MSKRKVDDENRVFQAKWESDYLFMEYRCKPKCLVCLQNVAVMKEYNLNRHYSQHKDKYQKYTGEARAAIIADLKGKLNRQQALFTKATTVQESSLKASYLVSLELAKAKKPLSDGEIVKQCAIQMAKAFGDDNMANKFDAVSLSRRTVTRRIFDIQSHVEGKLKQVMKDCVYFSLALDESTDVTDVSQLLIYTRAIDSTFHVHEELLKCVGLHGTTKGSDVFAAVKGVVTEYGGFDKLSAVVTDGAPSMQGRRTGFAGLLQQSGVTCPILHCIIHQVGSTSVCSIHSVCIHSVVLLYCDSYAVDCQRDNHSRADITLQYNSTTSR